MKCSAVALFLVAAQLEKIYGVLFTLKGSVTATAQSVSRLDARVKCLEEIIHRHFSGGASSSASSDVDSQSNTSSASAPLAFPIPADNEVELDALELQLSDPNNRKLLVSICLCGDLPLH